MAQNANVTIPGQRYSRADFTALRARLNKIPTGKIMHLYYAEDALEALGCSSPGALERRLDGLRENLAQRAVLCNPALALHLANARAFNSWPKSVVAHLVQAADQDMSQALPQDAVAAWFKPLVAQALQGDGITTLAQFKQCIETRGVGWYRPIARLGAKKAAALENWLRNQPKLGALRIPDDVPAGSLTLLGPGSALTPLERIGSISHELAGAQGCNRCERFCLISSRNDLEAVQAYLYKFRGQDKTLRAYRKELERFLLWCVLERGQALSSTLTHECEAYKDFLANVPAHWVGSWAPRHSTRWRPFAGPLAPTSQRYAVQVIRSCFEWLVRVRYLGGNPWVTVADPGVAVKEVPLDIDKALPGSLWAELVAPGGLLDQVCRPEAALQGEAIAPKDARVGGAQYRLARAAILLMGYSGLRREEVCRASRHCLRRVPEQPDKALWELKILGKRNKWRTVFMPGRVIEALQAHWADRGQEFSDPASTLALLSPVVIAPSQPSQRKHWAAAQGEHGLTGAGFTPDALYQVVTRALRRMAKAQTLALTQEQRATLERTTPHALRHTFGTNAAASMPIDVLQRLMGHVSLATTSLYVQAERARSIEEVGKLFAL